MTEFCCDALNLHTASDDTNIEYVAKFREFGIGIQDGGSALQIIRFCPFCGTKLPESLRDEWFECLERQGIDPIKDDVEEPYASDAWWIDKLETN